MITKTVLWSPKMVPKLHLLVIQWDIFGIFHILGISSSQLTSIFQGGGSTTSLMSRIFDQSRVKERILVVSVKLPEGYSIHHLPMTCCVVTRRQGEHEDGLVPKGQGTSAAGGWPAPKKMPMRLTCARHMEVSMGVPP